MNKVVSKALNDEQSSGIETQEDLSNNPFKFIVDPNQNKTISGGYYQRSISPNAQSRSFYDSIYFQMTKQELVDMIQKQKGMIYDLNQRKDMNNDFINRMRHDYLKELSNLREQVVSKEQKGKKFEYIDVHFFEPTEMLSPEICYLLNKKIEEMKEIYENCLLRMQITNNQLMKEIALFEKLGEDGNIGIKFSEMNADSVIRKLQKIERDPRIIWKSFDEYYGYGFFFDVLEYEFGITPDTHHKLIEKFDQEINTYKSVANTQISSITEKTQVEIERLRKELDEKNLEISMIKQKNLVDLERMKKDIKDAMEVKCQGMLAAQFRKFDEEKAELFEQMKELDKAATNYKTIKIEYDMKLYFSKWLFVSKLRKIKSLGVDEEERAKIADSIEKQMFEREQTLQNQKNSNQNLKEDLIEAKNEINELCSQLADLQYANFSMKKEKDYFQDKIQEIQGDNDKLSQELSEVRTQEKIYKDEYLTYRENFETSQKYVKALETENGILKQKILRLNEIAEQYMQAPEQVESAFSVAAKGSQKAINELNQQFLVKVDEIYFEKMKDKATLTNLFGLNKTIEKKDEDKLPSVAKEVQATIEIQERDMQTDLEAPPNIEELIQQQIQKDPNFALSPLLRQQNHQNVQNQGYSKGKYRGRGAQVQSSNRQSNEDQNEAASAKKRHPQNTKAVGNSLYSSQQTQHKKQAPSQQKIQNNRIQKNLNSQVNPPSQAESFIYEEGGANNSIFNVGGGGKNNSSFQSQERLQNEKSFMDDQMQNYQDGQDYFDEDAEDENQEQTDENQEKSTSQMIEVLDADEELKRQISEEVRQELLREQIYMKIYANSKEIQYSEQSSSKGDYLDKNQAIKSSKDISFKKGSRRANLIGQPSSPSQSQYKIVPFCLRNMERLLHKGFHLDKKDMGIQTDSFSWINMLQNEIFNAQSQTFITSNGFLQENQFKYQIKEQNSQSQNQRQFKRPTTSSSPYHHCSNSSLFQVINKSSARQVPIPFSSTSSQQNNPFARIQNYQRSSSNLEQSDFTSLQITGKNNTNLSKNSKLEQIKDGINQNNINGGALPLSTIYNIHKNSSNLDISSVNMENNQINESKDMYGMRESQMSLNSSTATALPIPQHLKSKYARKKNISSDQQVDSLRASNEGNANITKLKQLESLNNKKINQKATLQPLSQNDSLIQEESEKGSEMGGVEPFSKEINLAGIKTSTLNLVISSNNKGNNEAKNQARIHFNKDIKLGKNFQSYKMRKKLKSQHPSISKDPFGSSTCDLSIVSSKRN